MRPITFICLILFPTLSHAQVDSTEPVGPFMTFKTTRIVNGHAPETLLKRDLDFRITHRFGDIAGNNGGYHTLYGIDQARDIRIAAEYGLTDDIDIGLGRSKGAGPIQEIWDGYAKYRFLKQTKDNSIPFTLTLTSGIGFTSMEASDDPTDINGFDKPIHRLSFFNQLIIGHRLSDRISLALSPTHVHRNFVHHEDRNGLFALGGAASVKVSKSIAILAEYFHPFPNERTVGNTVYNAPLSFGLEYETGGHVFHITFSNSSGIGPMQFIPYTDSNWADGQFRFGFTISRLFRT